MKLDVSATLHRLGLITNDKASPKTREPKADAKRSSRSQFLKQLWPLSRTGTRFGRTSTQPSMSLDTLGSPTNAISNVADASGDNPVNEHVQGTSTRPARLTIEIADPVQANPIKSVRFDLPPDSPVRRRPERSDASLSFEAAPVQSRPKAPATVPSNEHISGSVGRAEKHAIKVAKLEIHSAKTNHDRVKEQLFSVECELHRARAALMESGIKLSLDRISASPTTRIPTKFAAARSEAHPAGSKSRAVLEKLRSEENDLTASRDSLYEALKAARRTVDLATADYMTTLQLLSVARTASANAKQASIAIRDIEREVRSAKRDQAQPSAGATSENGSASVGAVESLTEQFSTAGDRVEKQVAIATNALAEIHGLGKGVSNYRYRKPSPGLGNALVELMKIHEVRTRKAKINALQTAQAVVVLSDGPASSPPLVALAAIDTAIVGGGISRSRTAQTRPCAAPQTESTLGGTVSSSPANDVSISTPMARQAIPSVARPESTVTPTSPGVVSAPAGDSMTIAPGDGSIAPTCAANDNSFPENTAVQRPFANDTPDVEHGLPLGPFAMSTGPSDTHPVAAILAKSLPVPSESSVAEAFATEASSAGTRVPGLSTLPIPMTEAADGEQPTPMTPSPRSEKSVEQLLTELAVAEALVSAGKAELEQVSNKAERAREAASEGARTLIAEAHIARQESEQTANAAATLAISARGEAEAMAVRAQQTRAAAESAVQVACSLDSTPAEAAHAARTSRKAARALARAAEAILGAAKRAELAATTVHTILSREPALAAVADAAKAATDAAMAARRVATEALATQKTAEAAVGTAYAAAANKATNAAVVAAVALHEAEKAASDAVVAKEELQQLMHAAEARVELTRASSVAAADVERASAATAKAVLKQAMDAQRRFGIPA